MSSSKSDIQSTLPSNKDQAYMKKYVARHPDSRMGWYFLGKQYEQAGEIGKAHYCYNQAGDVFKAFENEPLPAEWAEQLSQRKQELLLQRQRRRRNAKLVALLVLFFAIVVVAPGGQLSIADKLATFSDEQGPSITEPRVEGNGHKQVKLLPASQGDRLGELIQSAIVAGANKKIELLIVDAKRDKQWLLWSQRPRPLWQITVPEAKPTDDAEAMDSADAGTSASRSLRGGALVQPLATPNCKCEEAKAQARVTANEWALEAERKLVTRSALTAAVSRGISLPDRWNGLAKPYPHNHVSGTTPHLAGDYAQLKAAFDKQLLTAGAGTQGKQMAAVKALWQANDADPFKHPLRIVIDKQRHRLAVVSGNILLRNYKVGLGGTRTPVGTFNITEKVVNPNGSATGTYGSRGMALSNSLYAIHGTSDLSSIGKDKSLGCIRMLPADVEELFDMVPLGAEVLITSGVLPAEERVPQASERFRVQLAPSQQNPNKVYEWLS
ncbi:L,D-transpeptidase [Paenibacillus sp. 481]|nr:L,D-transpeptidase [Paenibacillus sp. 481]